MPPNSSAYLVGAIFGGLMAGFFCGAGTFALGKAKERLGLGIAGWIVCTIGGGILGLLLAVPLAILFIIIILALGAPPERYRRYRRSRRDEDDEEDYRGRKEPPPLPARRDALPRDDREEGSFSFSTASPTRRHSADDRREDGCRRGGRPVAAEFGSSSTVLLIVGLVGGGVVLLAGGGIAVYYMTSLRVTPQAMPVQSAIDRPRPVPPPVADVNRPPVPPPDIRLELPPSPTPVAMTPAPIREETPYKLPERVGSIRVGGGGRFLILHFPKIRKLGVFDTNEAKIVRYIAAPEDDVLFAGGMTQLLVYLPGSQVVQRYNLLTGERESVGKLDLPPGKVEAFCMGHASAGPLLVSVHGQGAMLFDIAKFAKIPLPSSVRAVAQGDNLYWAGATGRIFGYTGTLGQPNGVRTVVFEGGGVKQYGEHQGTWFVMPGPDDKHVYPGGHGVVSDRVKSVPNVPFTIGPGSGVANHLYLPATHGPYYLHAQTIDNTIRGDKTPTGTVSLFMLGDKRPIATYDKTAVCKYDDWKQLQGLGIEYSIHLIPKAKLLVIVPASRDELRLYPADLDAALDKSGRDYLLFTSSPPGRFEKGKEFTYQVEVKAKKTPTTLALTSAPEGMTVSASGLVRWAIPADFATKRVDVILSVKDNGGQEAFQTFTLEGEEGK